MIPDGEVNIDFHGYFQNPHSLSFYSRADVKEWFRIKEDFCDLVPLRENPYTAAHVRRGDYLELSHLYCLVSKESYIDAAKKYDIDPTTIVWLQEETQSPHPILLENKIGFLSDFLTIMWADTILRANSTFSWWAATLSDARIYAPVVNNLTGQQRCEFVPGNHPKMYSGWQDLHLKEA